MREMLHVVTYDVADDRVRQRIARALERVGVRVQDSVFELRADRAAAQALLHSLDRMRLPGDSIRLYAVPEDGRRASRQVGGAPISEAGEFWLL